jgi:transposase
VQENKAIAELTFHALGERAKVLEGQVEDLTHEVERLRTRVKELEGQASKNSQNSSKPPSTDGLKKKKKTTSLRVASGKKPGGQPGHAGTTLRRIDTPDVTVVQPLPVSCDACHTTLSSSGAQIHKRAQVFDIPGVRFEVIEYHTLSLRCQCGKLHQSELPAQVYEVAQYGPNIRALAVHLTQGQLLPFARACELIKDLYHLDISPATLLQWVHEGAQLLTPMVQAIAQKIQDAAVVNVDESGLRVDLRLQWLHTAVTPTHTWYGVHPKRGLQAIQDHGILLNYVGILVHDCWAPYWSLSCDHALCGAHLLRELIFQKETRTQAWPQQIIDTLLAADQACKAAREANTVLTAAQIEAFCAQYRAHVQDGQAQNRPEPKKPGQRGRAKQSIAFNLLRRLHEREQEVLHFIRDLTVPFTNNLAERAIRMPKVKQRISGCFRTLIGAENFCVIRSYLDTARKQGFGMLHAMQAAFSGQPLALA